MGTQAIELLQACIETKNPRLDLGNCGLIDRDFIGNSIVDQMLRRCTHLQTLILSDRWWDPRTKKSAVSQNSGEHKNLFSYLPSALFSLNGLKTLIFCGEPDNKFGINDMSFVSNFPVLEWLDLSNNNIEKIAGLKNLNQLKVLDLNSNRISLIDGLENLVQLEELDLGGNQIRKIKGLENLVKLQKLFLYRNSIKNISGLATLTMLKEIYLYDNIIETLDNLKNFAYLRTIHLGQNNITSIAELENVTTLRRLYFNGNRITNIGNLGNLKKLELLILNDNDISDIKPLIPILKRTKNRLKIVFKESFDSKPYDINLDGNPLTTPPIEIVQQGNEAVLNYFAVLEEQGIEYLYEAKMLIVGQPRAGKTSLRYKLFDSGADLPTEDKTTRGIDIQRLNFDVKDAEGNQRKFYYNIWDFGGQQIYQTTHQFFLTHRSLYVLVMDTGKDSIGNDDNTINYWLQALELLGGGSPLLLVRNEKSDRKINIDIPQKRTRFNFLKKDYGLNLNALIPQKPSFRIDQLQKFESLKQDIETELNRLPLVGFPMPKNWVQIRNELQKLSADNHYISKTEFIEICKKNEVVEYERQMELSRIFHDLGVFLHFQSFANLEDFIILQNTWATDAVFAVFDNENVQINKGRFSDEEVSEIWKDKLYEPAVHIKLLNLMMQFELCYQVEKSRPGIYIIPEMLSETAPDGCQWHPKDDLPVLYKYDFMPKGILARLIVRMNRLISIYNDQQVVWKTGVKIDGEALDCLNTEAEIGEAWNNKQLNVRAHGPFAKDLMSKITYEIDQLNNEYFRQIDKNDQLQKSRWYKMIPCNCISCKESETKHFYDYKDLLERKEFGKKTIECERKPYATVNIAELIDGVFAKETKEGSSKKNSEKSEIKIFVSYSNQDRDLRELIVDGLKVHLSEKGKISYNVWSDREIDLGAEWKTEIERELKASNVAILLVSASFAASKFIKENELTEFFKRKKEDGYLILPVLVRSYNFQEFEKLSSLNFFKTYYSDYGFKKPTQRNKLMPFDVLGEDADTTNKQLHDYYRNLSDYLHKAVTNYLK